MGACNSTKTENVKSEDDYSPAITFTGSDKSLGRDLFDQTIRKVILVQLPEASGSTVYSIINQKWADLFPNEQAKWYQQGHDKISALKF